MATSIKDDAEAAKGLATMVLLDLSAHLGPVVKVTLFDSGARVEFSSGSRVLVPIMVLDQVSKHGGSLGSFLLTREGQRAGMIIRGSLVGSLPLPGIQGSGLDWKEFPKPRRRN